MQRRHFMTAAAGAGLGASLGAWQTAVGQSSDEKVREKRGQIWKCQKCGTMVEILETGTTSLEHCNSPMVLVEVKTIEQEGKEKHVPVIEKDGDVFRVKVGSVLHPMTRPHYIGWITLKTPYGEFRKFLDVDEEPIAEFPIPSGELPPGPIVAQEWCNLHGLWKSEYKPSE